MDEFVTIYTITIYALDKIEEKTGEKNEKKKTIKTTNSMQKMEKQ